jgi:hypothetical protein
MPSCQAPKEPSVSWHRFRNLMVMVNLTFYAYLFGALEFLMSWIILQSCGEKYGGMAPKKPLISKVGKNEFQKKKTLHIPKLYSDVAF